MTDAIDQKTRTMNRPTELFNRNDQPPTPHVVQQIQRPMPEQNPFVTERPRTRRTFGVTPEDIASATPTQTVDTLVSLQRRQLSGSFAAVRAARTMHQYLIDFWDSAGVVDVVVGAVEADPSQEQLDQMYNDFLLFSYLPQVMLPSKPAFIDMATPSKRAAVLQSSLPRMGISTTPQQAQASTGLLQQETVVVILLPAPAPYAERLTSFCNGREIFKLDNRA